MAECLSVFSRGTVPYVLSLYDSKSCIFLMVLCFSLEINWVTLRSDACVIRHVCRVDVSSLSACLLLGRISESL